MTFNFGDESISDSDSELDGGQIILQMKMEGPVGNGLKTGSVLTRGFAAKLRVGKMDPTKFIMDFYGGTFRGLDSDNEPYTDNPGYGILEANSLPEFLIS